MVSVPVLEEEVGIGLSRGLRKDGHEGRRGWFFCKGCGIGREGCLEDRLDNGVDVNARHW